MLVGIPTLNRYDLLDLCLESLAAGTLQPSQVFVIDNGGSYVAGSGWPFPLDVVKPGRNLGVAASWNLLHRLSQGQDLILLNDDVELAADSLARLALQPAPFVSLCDTPGFEARRTDPGVRVSDWSCFLQRTEVWERVGTYDEAFWPGGYEDCDYWRRMLLAELTVTRLPQTGMRHRVSATLEHFSDEERRELDAATVRNDAYYQRKWGGPPGREQFSIPFNEIAPAIGIEAG